MPDSFYNLSLPKPPQELVHAFFRALETYLEPYNDLDLLNRKSYRTVMPAKTLVRDVATSQPDLYQPFADYLVRWRRSTGIPSPYTFEEEVVFHFLSGNSTIELDGWTHRIHANLAPPNRRDESSVFYVLSDDAPVFVRLAAWCHAVAEFLLEAPFQHLGILPPGDHLIEITTGDSRDLKKQGDVLGYYEASPFQGRLGLTIHGCVVVTDENVPVFYRIGLIAHELLHAALDATLPEACNDVENFEHGGAFARAARALDFGKPPEPENADDPPDNADAANIATEDEPPAWARDAHDEVGTLPVHQHTPAEERRRGSARYVRRDPGVYLVNLRQHPVPPDTVRLSFEGDTRSQRQANHLRHTP